MSKILRKFDFLLVIILPVICFLAEKLVIANVFALEVLDFTVVWAIIGGILRELFWPSLLLVLVLLAGLQKHKLGRGLVAIGFVIFILFSLFNIMSFRIASMPLKVEHLIDIKPLYISSLLNAINAVLTALSLAYLALVFRTTVRKIEDFPLKIALGLALLTGLCFFVTYSPSFTRHTITWEEALKQAHTNIYLDFVFKDPLTFFVNSLKFKIPTGGKQLKSRQKEILTNMGFRVSRKTKLKKVASPAFRKIVLIVFESLDRDYLHTYNDKIPPEASSFFDLLVQNHTAVDNFYTSNYPSAGALYSLTFSRIPYLIHYSKIYEHLSLFSIFKKVFPDGKTALLRNFRLRSGGDWDLVRETFKIEQITASQKLRKKYQVDYDYPWEVKNDIVFAELLAWLDENKQSPGMILCKTLDGHFPYHIKNDDLEGVPEAVRRHPSPIVKTIYWNNMLLQRFFEQVKEKNLFTPDTLFIVTSDHTPNPNYGHLELPGIKNFEQLGKIPLVFVSANPKPLQNIERNKIASQVDLPVTLCSLLGIEAPWYYQGRDLTCSATLPLSIGHLNEHFYIKTASRSYIIPQQIGNKSLNAEEEAIHKFFAVQNTVEFNRQDF